MIKYNIMCLLGGFMLGEAFICPSRWWIGIIGIMLVGLGIYLSYKFAVLKDRKKILDIMDKIEKD